MKKLPVKGGTVRWGNSVGDACLPVHFSCLPEGMVWNHYAFKPYRSTYVWHVTRSWTSPCPVTWLAVPVSRGGRSVFVACWSAKLPSPFEESLSAFDRMNTLQDLCVPVYFKCRNLFPISRKSNIFMRLIHVTFNRCPQMKKAGSFNLAEIKYNWPMRVR